MMRNRRSCAGAVKFTGLCAGLGSQFRDF